MRKRIKKKKSKKELTHLVDDFEKIKNLIIKMQNRIGDKLQNIKTKITKKANLHTHSKESDGRQDFDTILIEEAKFRLALEHLYYCRPQYIEGYKNSKYINHPVLIPAVEFDCFYQNKFNPHFRLWC